MNPVTHDIELKDASPVSSKRYRMSPKQRAILESEVQKMLELGVIKEVESDYSSPMMIVEARGKDPRPCIDYRYMTTGSSMHSQKTKSFQFPTLKKGLSRLAQ